MYSLAKSAREKLKAKARSLAGEKDRKTDSSDWSPAKPLRAEVKTGARPIMKPSSKGIGESNAAADTKAAIGNPKRGAFKSGGAVKDAGVKDKKALGAIDPSPKRGAAGHYKKGGKIKKAGGGELPSAEESMRSAERLGEIKATEKKPARPAADARALPPASEAAERSGKFQNYKKGGRTAKATGGGLIGALKGGKKARSKGAKTDINIVINAGKTPPRHPAADMAPAGGVGGPPMPAIPPMPPAPLMGAGAPPAGAPPMPFKKGGRVGKFYGGGMMGALGGMPAQAMGAPPATLPAQAMANAQGRPFAGGAFAPPGLARKSGGRITKVASSYKDMEAGAATGEGRLQKTDIAKHHKDAPARKAGGRISKVAKSYKDMTAGSESGEGRLQKTDIAKAKMGRGK